MRIAQATETSVRAAVQQAAQGDTKTLRDLALGTNASFSEIRYSIAAADRDARANRTASLYFNGPGGNPVNGNSVFTTHVSRFWRTPTMRPLTAGDVRRARDARLYVLAQALLAGSTPPSSVRSAYWALGDAVRDPEPTKSEIAAELAQLQLSDEWSGFFDTRTHASILVQGRYRPELASKIDAAQNHALLTGMFKQQAPCTANNAALANVAAKLPTDVVRVAERAGLSRMGILRSGYALSPEAEKVASAANIASVTMATVGTLVAVPLLGISGLLGGGLALLAGVIATGVLSRIPTVENPVVDWASRYRKNRGGTTGTTDRVDNALRVASYKRPRSDDLERTIAHELMHLVDNCSARHGALSAEPEFYALYTETASAHASGDFAPDAPSTYGLASPAEMFAEAACAYLDIARDGTDTLSAETLKRYNPKLYAYFERLFLTRLPTAIASNDVQPYRAALYSTSGLVEALRRDANDRSTYDWQVIAQYELQRADLAGDATALGRAEKAIAEAEKFDHPSPWNKGERLPYLRAKWQTFKRWVTQRNPTTTNQALRVHLEAVRDKLVRSSVQPGIQPRAYQPGPYSAPYAHVALRNASRVR